MLYAKEVTESGADLREYNVCLEKGSEFFGPADQKFKFKNSKDIYYIFNLLHSVSKFPTVFNVCVQSLEKGMLYVFI